MGKKITKKSRISVKKKRWYTVQAPKVLNNIIFGETLTSDPALLKGRVFTVALSVVNRVVRGSNISVKFKVIDVQGNNCITEFVGYEMAGGFIKRLVKRAKRRVDDSFVLECKDKVKFRFKPLLLVKTSVQHSLQSDLRHKVKEHMTKLCKEKEYSEVVAMILQGTLQKDIKSECRKIHPMLNFDVRALKKL